MLVGDIGGAWRSMLSPENLGPLERDALLTKWGIRRDSFQGRLTDLITNPAVLLSIFLTFRFPVPTARNLFKAKEGIDGMLAKIPILRTLVGPHTSFHGTKVPGILDGLVSAKKEIFGEYMERQLGPAFSRFEQSAGRAINAREQIIVFNWLQKAHEVPVRGWDDVGILMPNLDQAMTTPMRDLAGSIRGTLDDTLTKVWKDPANIKALRAGVKRMAQNGTRDEELEQLVSLLDSGGYDGIPNYVPHRVVRTEADIKRLRDATIATANNKDFQRASQYKLITFLGREFYQRKGGMMPAMQELLLVGDLVDPAAYMRLQNSVRDKLVDGLKSAGMSKRSLDRIRQRPLDEVLSNSKRLVEEGEHDLFTTAIAEHMPAQYSMKLEPVLQSYYHSVASTYAWTIKGYGPQLLGEVQRAKALARVDSRAAWRAHVLENNIVPSALGKPTPRQVINAGLWDQRMGTIVATLERPSVRRLVGDKFADGMKEYYQANYGSFSLRGLTQKASSYFYLSTLGLNASAAFKNPFQNIITTGPLVGFKNYFGGQMDAWNRAGKYFERRLSGKLSHHEALIKTYPEFASAQLAESPITDESMGRAFDAAFRIHKTAPGGSVSRVDQAKRFAMALFSSSEVSNRLGAFHAGLRHAKQGGLKGAEALEHARQITISTQFIPTLASQPIAFSPGGALSNPLIRQLAQFPLRTLEFTILGVQEAIAGNPARMARQVAGAYITSEIGDVLGLNLGDALLGSALPVFTNVDERGNILAPLPIVPPAVALVAGAASAIGSGDWEVVHRQLPLLVPGGVGLARAIGFIPGLGDIPQAAARGLGRRWADYDNVNPLTGRIPVYTGGGSLTGYFKPWELVRHAIGIKGGALDEEATVARRLAKDADLIRASRREYTDALFANDPRKAARISAEYEVRFGHKMAIPATQIRQMQKRRKLTRIERQLSSLPRTARPQYEQAIRESGLRKSMSPRARALSPQTDYTNDLGLLDELDPYAISRYRNIPSSSPHP